MEISFFTIGIVLMLAAAGLAVVFIVLLTLKKRRLRQTMEEEYGDIESYGIHEGGR